tara:strand:- start:9 stop:953 length:945 start_codon:yes stop_codon:yes gene_type:complete
MLKNKPKILITGGGGYIGSVLIGELIKKNFEVAILDKFIFKQKKIIHNLYGKKIQIIEGDVRDNSLIKNSVKNIDIIIPLAAIVGAPLCKKNPQLTKSVNVGSVKTLVKNLSKNQIILVPTTNSGYGIGKKNSYCTEKSPLKPVSLYGQTKVLAEKIILDHHNSSSLRLATVFGTSPRMRVDLLVNDFVFKAFKTKKITLFEGHFRRNYIHINDVCRTFLFAIKNFDKFKNNIFNVGLSSANLTKKELCNKIKKFIPDLFIEIDEFAKDPDKRDYIVSNKKLEKTGFKTKYSINFGIKQLLNYYKKNKKIYKNV